MNKQRADAKALFGEDSDDEKRPKKAQAILEEYVFEETVQKTAQTAKKEPKYMGDLLKRSRERQADEQIVQKRKLEEKLATQTDTNYISESYKQELAQRKHIRIGHQAETAQTEAKVPQRIVENTVQDDEPVDMLKVDEIKLAQQVKEAKERYLRRQSNKA